MKSTINFRNELGHNVIDGGGNHKIGKRIVNPKAHEGNIGDTYNPKQQHEGIVERTGHVPKFIYTDQESRRPVRVQTRPNAEPIITPINNKR